MPTMSFPNQRLVCVHRERASSNFLGIKNTNWQAASRDLGAHALQLYLYLAANADNYTFALSPTAIRQAIGMARSTYHDQFRKLVDKGYLVQSKGNTFEFYEVPQAVTQTQNAVPDNGLNFEECPSPDEQAISDGQSVLPEDTEININYKNNNGINNRNDPQEDYSIYIPKVKEVVISRPVAEGKDRPKPKEQKNNAAFEF